MNNGVTAYAAAACFSRQIARNAAFLRNNPEKTQQLRYFVKGRTGMKKRMKV